MLNTFASLMAEGVEGDVTEMTVGSSGIACRLHVRWPDPADKGRGVDFFHVYMVRDGRVSEIRRYDDRASALAAVNTPPSD